MSAEFNATPEHGWTCFHCGEHFPPTFGGQRDAKAHFGGSMHTTPGEAACLTRKERGLLLVLREAQEQLGRYREEDTDLHRELRRLESDHAVALRREEEKGYARGLIDGRAMTQSDAAVKHA